MDVGFGIRLGVERYIVVMMCTHIVSGGRGVRECRVRAMATGKT